LVRVATRRKRCRAADDEEKREGQDPERSAHVSSPSWSPAPSGSSTNLPWFRPSFENREIATSNN
jgi:hypothetical protein